MKSTIDDIAMLLSTDWFFKRWGLWDLKSNNLANKSMQQMCRSIVLDLLDGESNYREVSHTEIRVRRTYEKFFIATSDCKLLESDVEFLRQVANETSDESKDLEFVTYLEILTQMIISDQESSVGSGISASLISKIAPFFEDDLSDEIIVLCENPRTEWDRKISKATSDLPARLGDFALSVRKQRIHFAQFWSKIRAVTTMEERKLICNWYEELGLQIIGIDISLPEFCLN